MKLLPRRGYTNLEGLQQRYDVWRDPITARLRDFSAVRKDDYFYELVYCLLTPQSSAVNAGKAVEALRHTECGVDRREPVEILASRLHYIRFHNTKAKHIAAARQIYPEVLRELSNGSDGRALREWLVRNVRGLGWKEASHFLRNIGHRNFAILDRHILRNLKKHGVLRSLPRTMTKRQYLRIEERFAQFAAEIRIPMDELDLLFWSTETGEILK